MTSQQKLLARYLPDLSLGKLEWIGLRPKRRSEMLAVNSTTALEGLGLEGDHRCDKTPGSGRQVTLISAEHIHVVAQLLKQDRIDPALLRRNLVVSGINLNVLRHQRFQIGDAIFLGTALCHPCSRMNENLGKGGAAAMYGHGGLCAKVLTSGKISVSDSVIAIPD